MKLTDIAARIGASTFGEELDITGIASLEDAGPGDISVYDDPRYARMLSTTRASAVVLAEPIPHLDAAQLVHPRPMLAFCDLLELFHPPAAPDPGVHVTAVVSPDVWLEDGVSIGPHVVLEAGARVGPGTVIGAGCFVGRGVTLGAQAVLKPRVVVLDGSRVGSRVVIHSGTVVGSDGYGYRWDGDRHRKVPQVGGVRIEDDVEIGANCTIDRATLGDTVIGAGTRLDNQVHVGHNVKIGRNCLIIAQVGIAGSATIGDGVVVAGQSGVADHAMIGDRAVVVGRSGVHGRVPAGAVVAGTPIMPHRLWRKASAALRRLPDLVRTVRRLESEVQGLSRRLPGLPEDGSRAFPQEGGAVAAESTVEGPGRERLTSSRRGG